MKNYIGIDLGTTNSAICVYDGATLRLFKSPEQNDVTASAIFIDKRGNKYVGGRAYDQAARNPESAATLFKRLMGTSTPVRLPAVNLTMTPEDCSAEVLRLLLDTSLKTSGTIPKQAPLSRFQLHSTKCRRMRRWQQLRLLVSARLP